MYEEEFDKVATPRHACTLAALAVVVIHVVGALTERPITEKTDHGARTGQGTDMLASDK